MTDLFAHLAGRAAVTPRMTAVRLAGEAVTYGELHESISGYRPVVDAQGLSAESALSAALMSFLPERLRELPPVDQADWVGAATRWLHDHATATDGPTLDQAV